MNIEEFVAYCSSKKAVTEEFPFDNDTLVCKVGPKIFALVSLKKWEEGTPSVNLKCNPERAVILREQYEDIVPGYHMSKVHWNTVYINKGVNDALIKQLVDDSYALVLKSLTKKIQQEISELLT